LSSGLHNGAGRFSTCPKATTSHVIEFGRIAVILRANGQAVIAREAKQSIFPRAVLWIASSHCSSQ
jgi:hypothetical protein